MSDPVSNSDIEDVLSSIRRLVSDEPKPLKEVDALQKPDMGRLVLTPAFRVIDENTPNSAENSQFVAANSDPAEELTEEKENQDDVVDLSEIGEVQAADDQPEHDPETEIVTELSETEDSVVSDSETVLPEAETADEDQVSDENVEDVLHLEALVSDQSGTDHATGTDDLNEENRAAELVEVEVFSGEPDVTFDEDQEGIDLPSGNAVLSAFEATGDWTDENLTDEEPLPIPAELSKELEAAAEAPANLSLQNRIAELEAAIQQAPHEWEPDGSEDGSDDETRPISHDVQENERSDPNFKGGEPTAEDDVLEATPSTEDLDGSLDVVQAETALEEDADVLSDVEVGEERAEVLTQEEPASAGVELTEEQAEALIQEESESVDVEPPEGQSEALMQEEPASADVEPTEEHAEVLAQEEPLVDEAAAEIEAQSAKLDPVETEIVETIDSEDDSLTENEPAADHSEDQSIETDDVQNIVVNEADQANETNEDTVQEDSDSAEDNDFAADGKEDVLADDLSTVDEEAMREVIAELIQNELQGVLGERITRNVRRLVRREIQRALAVRDLE